MSILEPCLQAAYLSLSSMPSNNKPVYDLIMIPSKNIKAALKSGVLKIYYPIN